MARRLRTTKERKAPLLASGGWLRFKQIQDLKLGPAVRRDVATGRAIHGPDDVADIYTSSPRRGFDSFEAMREAWRVHGHDLMAENPRVSWWAWTQFARVTVGDLVQEGGDDE